MKQLIRHPHGCNYAHIKGGAVALLLSPGLGATITPQTMAQIESRAPEPAPMAARSRRRIHSRKPFSLKI